MMHRIWLLIVCVGVTGLSGCGGAPNDGPPRYRVSGTGTYKGAPVPRGQLIFTPDKSRGNSGPQGRAEIRDGKFDTGAGGAGMIGGPHMVRIDGLDGVQPADDVDGHFRDGSPLFIDYQQREDFANSAVTREYSVPESAGGGH